MIPLFLGLTLANLTCLSIALILGYLRAAGRDVGQYHLIAGALAAIACCGVHCVVFTYFVATAKWVQHAILVKGLDAALAAPTRSFKLQAFPAALLAMLMVFLTAVMGAAVDNYRIAPLWHHATALAMLATNVIVAAVEFAAIRRNGLLVDDILARIARPQTDRPAPTSQPAAVRL
jgi:hypothetical protein